MYMHKYVSKKVTIQRQTTNTCTVVPQVSINGCFNMLTVSAHKVYKLHTLNGAQKL